ncbi:MAG: immune inhibitor A [Bacteroidales bacterium]|nr:immune inhibitor A [Bacteroidales bacterium]
MKHFFTSKFLLLTISLLFTLTAFSESHLRVKVNLDGRDLKEIAQLGIPVESGSFKPGVFFIAEYSEKELELLSQAGFLYEILIHDMSSYYLDRNKNFDRDELNRQLRTGKSSDQYQTPENFMLGSMGGFHTYDELLDDLDAMHTLFPNLISQKQPIGETLTIENRPVYWVRISNNPNETQDKPRVLYTALTHAREPASMQQMLFQMWYLLENYDSDPEIKYLVDNVEMYFVPAVNPDGYIFCETTNPNGGSMHRKNKRINSDGSIGVDLNRNFGYQWGYDNSGSSPNPSAQTYRGTGPFSEPETQLVKELAETFNFSLALNNHTYSDLLIYPWGYSSNLTPDGDIFIEYAKIMTRENNYIYGTCYETLNYFANGGSDDWFYGEQVTKDKVFAFTPEAGKPSDGFWPAMNRIEEICAGHTHMNLSLARLALAYAEVEDLTDIFISESSAEFEFRITNYGQLSTSGYTVSIIPLNYSITGVGDPIQFENMEVLQSETASISLELYPELNSGAEIKFILSLDNGDFAWNDTITKFYGQPEVIFFDPCDNLNNWTTSTWGVSNSVYYSAPGSIADSPGSNYPNNANTHITLSQPFNFTDVAIAWAEFQTRYNIELNWDYVQFMYSVDGQQNWIPLEGNYTQTGGSNQDTGKPLYHGAQNSWVQEFVDLSHLVGQEEVWFRFRLYSDGYINKEGFYFDDFTIKSLLVTPGFLFLPPESFSFYQHQDLEINFSDYITWNPDPESFQISWEGNENLTIEKDGTTIIRIQNTDVFWIGEESIVFTITDGDLEFSEVIVISAEPVPAPVVSGQEDITISQGSSFYFQPWYLHVEDLFFNYPEEFEITLFEGDDYTIVLSNIIQPSSDFHGTILLPVSVNNGFVDSDIYNMEIMVTPETAVEELENDITRIYYNKFSEELIINFSQRFSNESFLVTINDITGRVLSRQSVTGSKEVRYNMQAYHKGVYIVTLSGAENFSEKIVVH